jgi:hypothetical protein
METILDKVIVKICNVCGPLTEEQVCRTKGRTYIECRPCKTERRRAKRLNNPEKFKAHREKYRFLERDPNIEKLRCSRCKEEKLLLEFNIAMLNIRYPYCRICSRAATRSHHQKPESKEKQKQWYNSYYQPISRNSRYLKEYGISLDDYHHMLEEQKGVCKICQGPPTKKVGKSDNFDIDHCHDTGKVRGLLCGKCNSGMGQFQDSRKLLLAAAKYLEENS